MAIEEAAREPSEVFSPEHVRALVSMDKESTFDLLRFNAGAAHACPLGSLASYLLRLLAGSHELEEEQAPLMVEDAVARLLILDWATVLASGWPLFGLVARVLDVAPSRTPLRLSGPDCRERAQQLRRTLQEREEGLAHRGLGGGWETQVPEAEALRLAATMGSLLFSCIRHADGAAQPYADAIADTHALRMAFESMQALQRLAYLRASCPPKSFAVWTKAGYRLCVVASGEAGQDSVVHQALRSFGAWEECEEWAAAVPRPPPCTILDGGANIGACTLLFASLGYQVVAFEADERNSALLGASLQLPQPPEVGGEELRRRVRHFHVALADWNGRGTLLLHADSSAGHQLQPLADVGPVVGGLAAGVPAAGGSTGVVEVATLDALLLEGRALNVPEAWTRDICFVKLDLEGGEFRALRGAERLLSSAATTESSLAVSFEFVPHVLRGMQGAGAPMQLLEWFHARHFAITSEDGAAEYGPSDFAGLAAEQDWGFSLLARRGPQRA